jgi:hypothetical protein
VVIDALDLDRFAAFLTWFRIAADVGRELIERSEVLRRHPKPGPLPVVREYHEVLLKVLGGT